MQSTLPPSNEISRRGHRGWYRPAARLAILAAGAFFMFVGGHAISTRLLRAPIGPQLEIAPRKIDLGVVKVGQTVERRLMLRNTGDQRLLITEVKSTCQCTVSELLERTLNRDETTAMKIAFTAANSGEKRQQVMLRSNDLPMPIAVVTISANAVD